VPRRCRGGAEEDPSSQPLTTSHDLAQPLTTSDLAQPHLSLPLVQVENIADLLNLPSAELNALRTLREKVTRVGPRGTPPTPHMGPHCFTKALVEVARVESHGTPTPPPYMGPIFH